MKRLAVLCLAAIASAQMYAQQARLDSVFTSSSDIAVENLFLHLDKYACLSGDSVWFKAYVFNGAYHPFAISTNLYIDVFKDNEHGGKDHGQLIMQKMFPIVKNEAIGQLSIPDTLQSGTYWLRAYTRYQTNFDSTQYFTVPVTVYNMRENTELVAKKRKASSSEPAVFSIDSSFYWIISPTDTGIICRFVADASSTLLHKQLHVVLASYHQPLFRAALSLDGQKDKIISFPTRNLLGNVDLLLLDDSNLIARQSVFLAEPEARKTKVQVLLDTLDPTPFGDNSWTLNIRDSELFDASVSVTDADLTSAMPINFLDESAPDPFDYHLALKGQLPTIRYADTAYLNWSGVVKKESGKPVGRGELIALISKDTASAQETRLIPIDANGHFTLDHTFFFDTAMVSFQLNNHKGNDASRNIQLVFDQVKVPDFNHSSTKRWEDSLVRVDTTAFVGYVKPLPPGAMVKELPKYTVRGWKDTRRELDDKYASGLFSMLTPYSFDVRTEKECTTVWEYLRKNLPGFSGGEDVGQLPTLNGQKIIFFVNEQVQSLSDLDLYWFNELAYIKAFNSFWIDNTRYLQWKTGFTSFSLSGGDSTGKKLKVPVQQDPPVISMYTRKGIDIRTAWAGLHQVPVPGYAPIAKFTGIRGNRMTLYWEPLAQLSPSKTFHVRFMNNTRTNNFRITVEGLTANGKRVHYENVIINDHGYAATAKL